MSGMKWANLKKMRCPKCDGKMIRSPGSGLRYCIGLDPDKDLSKCEFRVSEERFNEIVMNMENGAGEDGRRHFEEGYGQ